MGVGKVKKIFIMKKVFKQKKNLIKKLRPKKKNNKLVNKANCSDLGSYKEDNNLKLNLLFGKKSELKDLIFTKCEQ